MVSVPQSYKEIQVSASILFLTLHCDVAAEVLAAGSIPTFGDLIARDGLVRLGVDRFNSLRAARRLPRPWAGTIAEFVALDLTPCTRAAFGSVSGQPGAAKVERQDIVSLCISHDALRSLGQPIIYTDRLCTRDDARFSGDRDILSEAAWPRIRRRDFKPDATDPGAVHKYDAAVLAWGAVPGTVVEAVVCKDVAAADSLRERCPKLRAEALVRPDLLW